MHSNANRKRKADEQRREQRHSNRGHKRTAREIGGNGREVRPNPFRTCSDPGEQSFCQAKWEASAKACGLSYPGSPLGGYFTPQVDVQHDHEGNSTSDAIMRDVQAEAATRSTGSNEGCADERASQGTHIQAVIDYCNDVGLFKDSGVPHGVLIQRETRIELPPAGTLHDSPPFAGARRRKAVHQKGPFLEVPDSKRLRCGGVYDTPRSVNFGAPTIVHPNFFTPVRASSFRTRSTCGPGNEPYSIWIDIDEREAELEVRQWEEEHGIPYKDRCTFYNHIDVLPGMKAWIDATYGAMSRDESRDPELRQWLVDTYGPWPDHGDSGEAVSASSVKAATAYAKHGKVQATQKSLKSTKQPARQPPRSERDLRLEVEHLKMQVLQLMKRNPVRAAAPDPIKELVADYSRGKIPPVGPLEQIQEVDTSVTFTALEGDSRIVILGPSTPNQRACVLAYNETHGWVVRGTGKPQIELAEGTNQFYSLFSSHSVTPLGSEQNNYTRVSYAEMCVIQNILNLSDIPTSDADGSLTQEAWQKARASIEGAMVHGKEMAMVVPNMVVSGNTNAIPVTRKSAANKTGFQLRFNQNDFADGIDVDVSHPAYTTIGDFEIPVGSTGKINVSVTMGTDGGQGSVGLQLVARDQDSLEVHFGEAKYINFDWPGAEGFFSGTVSFDTADVGDNKVVYGVRMRLGSQTMMIKNDTFNMLVDMPDFSLEERSHQVITVINEPNVGAAFRYKTTAYISMAHNRNNEFRRGHEIADKWYTADQHLAAQQHLLLGNTTFEPDVNASFAKTLSKVARSALKVLPGAATGYATGGAKGALLGAARSL